MVSDVRESSGPGGGIVSASVLRHRVSHRFLGRKISSGIREKRRQQDQVYNRTSRQRKDSFSAPDDFHCRKGKLQNRVVFRKGYLDA